MILGAPGQLSREVVRELAAREHAVWAAVRRTPVPAFGNSVEMRADARNKNEICEAMRGADAGVNASLCDFKPA